MSDDDLGVPVPASLGTEFDVRQEIGAEGAPRAFAARDKASGRDVIVRFLARELALGISLDRFVREIRSASVLASPNILPMVNAGSTSDGDAYYVTQHVRGETLRERMQHGRLAVGEIISVLRDVARALAVGHRHRVIHRDLIPDNVILSFGSAIVDKFGLTKAIIAARARTSGGESRPWPPLGTGAYMSPEQAAGDEVDARADLYAWGLIAYELLAGEHAFPGKRNSGEFRDAQRFEAPVHLMLRLPDAPVALSELVMRCLEKDPSRRPVSATELVRVLEDQALMAPPAPIPETLPVGTSGKQVLFGAFVALLVAGFVFGAPAAVAHYRESRTTVVSVYRGEGIPITTLAVLPFAHGSGVDTYVADGIAGDVARTLSRFQGINVVGRASADGYRDASVNPLDVGKRLSVGAYVSASVARTGALLHVKASLINANDGHALWSEQYDRPAADLAAVEAEIVQRVVGVVEPTLNPRAPAEMVRAITGTANVSAYDQFLRGLAARDNPAEALAAFQHATTADARFARAHAAIALTYAVSGDALGLSPDSARSLAVVAATRALALDSGLGEAHLAMSALRAAALDAPHASMESALALSALPGSAAAHEQRAKTFLLAGRPTDALAEVRQAIALDPASGSARETLMRAELASDRFDDVQAEWIDGAAIDSTRVAARMLTALALAMAGHSDSALHVLDALTRTHTRVPGVRATQVIALAEANRWTDAARMRAEVQDARPRSGYDMLVSNVVFGDTSAALRLLEQTAQRASDLALVTGTISCDPALAPLRNSPRFQAFATSHGMAICPATAAWPITPRSRRATPDSIPVSAPKP